MARNMPLKLLSAAIAAGNAYTKTYQQIITMKLIKVTALGLFALCLGACASKPSTTTTMPPPGPTHVMHAK